MKTVSFSFVFLAGFLCFTTGCGTIGARCTPEEARRSLPVFYPATQMDFFTIHSGGGVYAYGDCDNGLGPVFGWCVAVPLSIADMPISLATDTIMLPFDFGRNSRSKKNNITASPVLGGGTNIYNYRKGAFYGRTDKNQKSSSWHNMTLEMIRPEMRSDRTYTNENLIQGYLLYDLHVSCNYDSWGNGKWNNLNIATTGFCYTGSIHSPATNIVDRLEVSRKGALLLHLVAGALYYARQAELSAITNSFAVGKLDNGSPGCLIKDAKGADIAVLDLDKKAVIAGAQGITVIIDPLNETIDVAESLCRAAGLATSR